MPPVGDRGEGRDTVGEFIDAELTSRDERTKNGGRSASPGDRTRLDERQAQRDRNKNADGDFLQTMNMVFVQERETARKEFKAADDEMQRAFEAKMAALEQRLKAVRGRLPVAKIWRADGVNYEGEFVCYDGALYQARKDTAQVPSGTDWVCVARAGRDGCDGRSPNVCGTYDVREKYERLDVVAFDGASFIARKDSPGICPDPGWQPLSRRGKPGRKGETGASGPCGAKGERGEPGVSIVSWQIDRERYRASPLMSNGTVGPMLELRELFQQFLNETAS